MTHFMRFRCAGQSRSGKRVCRKFLHDLFAMIESVSFSKQRPEPLQARYLAGAPHLRAKPGEVDRAVVQHPGSNLTS
eukprot:4081345-Prymnesium_polylepis.1